MKNKIETKGTIEEVSYENIKETQLNVKCCHIVDNLRSDEFIS